MEVLPIRDMFSSTFENTGHSSQPTDTSQSSNMLEAQAWLDCVSSRTTTLHDYSGNGSGAWKHSSASRGGSNSSSHGPDTGGSSSTGSQASCGSGASGTSPLCEDGSLPDLNADRTRLSEVRPHEQLAEAVLAIETQQSHVDELDRVHGGPLSAGDVVPSAGDARNSDTATNIATHSAPEHAHPDDEGEGVAIDHVTLIGVSRLGRELWLSSCGRIVWKEITLAPSAEAMHVPSDSAAHVQHPNLVAVRFRRCVGTRLL